MLPPVGSAHRAPILGNCMKFSVLFMVRKPRTHDGVASSAVAIPTIHRETGAFWIEVLNVSHYAGKDEVYVVGVTLSHFFVGLFFAGNVSGRKWQKGQQNVAMFVGFGADFRRYVTEGDIKGPGLLVAC